LLVSVTVFVSVTLAVGLVANTLLSVIFAVVIAVVAAATAIVANRIEFAGVAGATGEAAGVPATTLNATVFSEPV
jgi:hypothetical protein